MRIGPKGIIATLATASLLFAACGDDDDTGTTAPEEPAATTAAATTGTTGATGTTAGEVVPGTHASEEEIFGICRPLGALGRGLVELAPAGVMGEDLAAPEQEIAWMRRLSAETGRPVSFALSQHEVDSRVGNTFAQYLRSFLRHDPEVIMIGEVRDSETAAVSSGVSLARYKTLAFGISAAYAGVAGGLFAIANTFVNPDAFPVALSIFLLIGIVVGGLGGLSGLVFGAIFVYFIPFWAQGADLGSLLPDRVIEETQKPGGPAIVYGVVLILLMFVIPNGVGGLFRRVGQLLGRRRRSKVEQPL